MGLFCHMNKKFKFGDHALDLNDPCVMGILNVTPDSFSDGGRFDTFDTAIEHAKRMVAAGASIIDVGGESTRPGADEVSVNQELERVIPVVKALAAEISVPISVDTSKPEVMLAAAGAGASLINDVRALRVPGSLEAAAETGLPVCLMHMQGEPESMQAKPKYADVVTEVMAFLHGRIEAALKSGIAREALLIDPGFGFGKSVAHNYQLLRELPSFKTLECPLLVGLSRKSMINAIVSRPAEERVAASVSLAVLAAERGANIIRVHDVAETCDGLAMLGALKGA